MMRCHTLVAGLILSAILCFSVHLPRCTSTTTTTTVTDHPKLYLSPSTFLTDYQKMVSSFKIYIYTNLNTSTTTTSSGIFHTSLLGSQFITQNPSHARLFYLPIGDLPNRSLDRLIARLRISHPFWNLSLAADHFYLSSCGGSPSAGPSSSRNVVELRKNAVRLSCFSAPPGFFVPHKDVSLPPLPSPIPKSRDLNREFCLFEYGMGGVEVAGIGEAMAAGCVPVIVADRPVQDMPLMDVVDWGEIAVFVGGGVGRDRLERILDDVDDERLRRMKRLGAAAARHLTWNDPPRPYDAFHMVLYQLWMRRHAVRYSSW